MEQQFPIALQVALYAASGAMIVLAAVVVRVLLRLEKQFDRVVAAAESVQAEITPLARETRLVMDRLHDLSASAQRDWRAVERVVGAAGGLLTPLFALNRAAQIVTAGAAAFVRGLWTGPRHDRQTAGFAGSYEPSRESTGNGGSSVVAGTETTR